MIGGKWAGWSFWNRTPAPPPPATSPLPPALTGPLRYLIGDDQGGVGAWRLNEIVEVGYDTTTPPKNCIASCYVNLLDEKNSHAYGDAAQTGTAADYNEGLIDYRGSGFLRNVRDQLLRRKKQGFTMCELDNPDSYPRESVLQAMDMAASMNFKIWVKNPFLPYSDLLSRRPALLHTATVGIIVERGCGTPAAMDDMRQAAGKPNMPVRFVFFGAGLGTAQQFAITIENEHYRNMGVTYSHKGEYERCEDILLPTP